MRKLALVIGVCMIAAVLLAHTNITNKMNGIYVMGSTNTITPDRNYLEKIERDGLLTNVVKLLVTDGYVCAVIGHKWEYGCGMSGCLVIHYYPTRHCVICGKSQIQKISQWQ